MTIAAPVVMSRTLYKDFSKDLVHRPDDLPDGVYDAVSSALRSTDLSKGTVNRLLCSFGECVIMGYAGTFSSISEGTVGMDMFDYVGARPNVCFVGFCVKDIESDTRFPSRKLCSRMYGWLMLNLWEDDSEGQIPSIISDYSEYDPGALNEPDYIDLMECYHHSEDGQSLMLMTNSCPRNESGYREVRNIQDITDPIPGRKGQKVGFLKSGRNLICIGKEELLLHENSIRSGRPLMISIYKVPDGKIRVISSSIPDAKDELPQDCLITGAGPFGSFKPLPLNLFAVLRDDLFGIVPDDGVRVLRKKVKEFKGGH